MHSELQGVHLHAFRSTGDITAFRSTGDIIGCIQNYRKYACMHSEVQEMLLDAFRTTGYTPACIQKYRRYK
jgi:hypothetical protein